MERKKQPPPIITMFKALNDRYGPQMENQQLSTP